MAPRPGFRLKGDSLYFLISHQSFVSLDIEEMDVWKAMDGEISVGDLRSRVTGDVDQIVRRLIDLQVCDLLPSSFPAERRRVVVIEPHMDDAALSVGGTMWLRRNECEFIVVTAAGISNYTIYYSRDCEYFDIETISTLRRAESALFVRLLGGRHIALDRLEAPLRYRDGRWPLDWFQRHRRIINAFVYHCAGPHEHEEWSSSLAEAVARLRPEEIWMPLGVGNHIDHEMIRSACLHLMAGDPELLSRYVIRLYQDVPYAGRFPFHTDLIVDALREAGARIEEERVDIANAVPAKIRLMSIFKSQFEIDRFRPWVEECARVAGAPMWDYGELLYRVMSPPTAEINPFMCYAEKDIVHELARRASSWLGRNRLAPLIRFYVMAPVGRWEDDVKYLLSVFPDARFEIHVATAYMEETETFASPRITVHPVKDRLRYWIAVAARKVFSRPGPVVIISGQGRERVARLLKIMSVFSDSIVAATMNHFVLALRAACRSASKNSGSMSADVRDAQ